MRDPDLIRYRMKHNAVIVRQSTKPLAHLIRAAAEGRRKLLNHWGTLKIQKVGSDELGSMLLTRAPFDVRNERSGKYLRCSFRGRKTCDAPWRPLQAFGWAAQLHRQIVGLACIKTSQSTRKGSVMRATSGLPP